MLTAAARSTPLLLAGLLAGFGLTWMTGMSLREVMAQGAAVALPGVR